MLPSYSEPMNARMLLAARFALHSLAVLAPSFAPLGLVYPFVPVVWFGVAMTASSAEALAFVCRVFVPSTVLVSWLFAPAAAGFVQAPTQTACGANMPRAGFMLVFEDVLSTAHATNISLSFNPDSLAFK